MILSIITVNKNNAEGLRKTILSVVCQTFPDFEYIIVDGNSSDSSVEIINDYVKQCSFPVSWVSENDSGIYDAMNKGIKMSHGDYLLFLNSGDTFVDEECVKRIFEKTPTCDIINARCNVVDGDKTKWTSPFLPIITLKTLYTIGLPHQSTFIKRELFERFGYYKDSYRYNADIAFWYKAILFGNATTVASDIIITNYDSHGISSVESKTERYAKEMSEILSEGILPRVIPDYEEEKEYRIMMREFEWIVSSPFTRFFLKVLKKIHKRLQ